MVTLLRIFCLLLAAAAPIFGDDANPSHKATWPAKDYSKVVGYRFKIPSDDAKGPVPSGFSLLTKAGLDAKQLANLTIKSAELSPAQVARLEKATFSTTHRTEPASCYDPHHIFVFYAKDGTVTNAIEVCFSCTGVATIPATTEEQWYCHDFVALTYLADELGLWLENRTTKAYVELQKEREKP